MLAGRVINVTRQSAPQNNYSWLLCPPANCLWTIIVQPVKPTGQSRAHYKPARSAATACVGIALLFRILLLPSLSLLASPSSAQCTSTPIHGNDICGSGSWQQHGPWPALLCSGGDNGGDEASKIQALASGAWGDWLQVQFPRLEFSSTKMGKGLVLRSI